MLTDKDLQKIKAVGDTFSNDFSASPTVLTVSEIELGISTVASPTELVCELLEKAESFGREASWKKVLGGEKIADAIAGTVHSKAILTGFAVSLIEAFDLKNVFCGAPQKAHGLRVERTEFCTKISFLAAPDTEFLVGAHGDSLPERMRDAARWSKDESYHSVLHSCHEKGMCVETAWKAYLLCERMAYYFRQGLAAAFLGGTQH